MKRNNKELTEAYRAYLEATDSRDKDKSFNIFFFYLSDIQDSIFRYIRLSDTNTQADIRQMIALKLLTTLDSNKLQGVRNLSGYLATLTLNISRDYLRKTNVYKKYKSRINSWILASGELWRSNLKHNDDYPQSAYILSNVYYPKLEDDE